MKPPASVFPTSPEPRMPTFTPPLLALCGCLPLDGRSLGPLQSFAQVRKIKCGTIAEDSAGRRDMRRKSYGCPVEAAVEVFGRKWKPVILWWLHQRTWRFAELRRQMPGITEKMLTHQLRELEADGVVARRVYPTVPPKVEYSLTEYGESLEQALEANGAAGTWPETGSRKRRFSAASRRN